MQIASSFLEFEKSGSSLLAAKNKFQFARFPFDYSVKI